MASKSDRELVKYEGEEFSVVERPSSTSAAVVKEKKDMLGTVDLGGLVSDLVTVGKFVRMAYNGVAGDTELQIQMRKIGFEVAELCDDSSLVITKFRIAADSVLTDLTGAYEFFLGDMEELALTSLESIGETAEEMSTEASKLHKRFIAEKDEVLKACEKVAKAKGLEEEELKKLRETQAKMKAEQEQEERQEAMAQEEERKLQREIDEAMIEERKAIETLQPHAADIVLAVLTAGVYPVYRIHKASKIVPGVVQGVQERAAKLQDSKEKQIKRRRRALRKIANCASEIARCADKEENVQDQAIAALHGAVGALSSLAAIMQNTAAFWRNMQTQCDAQAKGKLLKLLATAQKIEDPVKRQEAYTNNGIKGHAIKMYVFWTAMELVCSDYTQQITASRQELYRYLSENPTFQESRDRIKLLCQDFHEEVEREDKKMRQDLKQIEKNKEESKSG